MSKLIYFCKRSGVDTPLTAEDLGRISRRLIPDNIVARAPVLFTNSAAGYAIINPVDAVQAHGASVCLGTMFAPATDWWMPGAACPDGTYALFRGDDQQIEVVTDAVASRSIWYVLTETLFIASTSQRAIIMLLGSFEPSDESPLWMLSSGCLGPGLSWDRRLRLLPGNSRLILDKASWQLHIRTLASNHQSPPCSDEAYLEQFEQVLTAVFSGLDLDKWVLPLSGGVDSRALLLMLKDRQGLRSITWGLRSSLQDRRNDAYIARHLAEFYGIQHEYMETDISAEPIEVVFSRFLVAGEGRVDHIAGYMDGFRIWKRLFEAGVSGVIRGDHAMGKPLTHSDREARVINGLLVMSDYDNAGKYIRDNFNDAQKLPEQFRRNEGESLENYTYRLCVDFRHPVIIAALNDLKCAYVEVMSPLLSRRIYEFTRNLPASLRGDKELLRRFVARRGSGHAFASNRAIADGTGVLSDSRIAHFINDELRILPSRNAMVSAVIRQVLEELPGQPGAHATGRRLRSALSSYIPDGIKRRLKRPQHLNLDGGQTALRAWIVCRMHQQLYEDQYGLKGRSKKNAGKLLSEPVSS